MKTTYSISINQTDDQGQQLGNLSMTTTDQADLMRLLQNAGITSSHKEEQWSDDPADQGVCPVCSKKPCGCEEIDENYANEPKPEVVSTPGGNEYGEQRPQQDQRRVTARQGDNPIKKEDVDTLAKALEEQYLKEWNTTVKEVVPALAAAGRTAVGALGRAAISSLASGDSDDSSPSTSGTNTSELGKYAAETEDNIDEVQNYSSDTMDLIKNASDEELYRMAMDIAGTSSMAHLDSEYADLLHAKYGLQGLAKRAIANRERQQAADQAAHKERMSSTLGKARSMLGRMESEYSELDEFLDANVTVSGVKGNQSTSTSSKGGSSNVSDITSAGTGGYGSGGAATGGNAGASNKAGANAKEAFDVGTQKTSQVGGNTTSNVSGVNITGQGGQGGSATATGGNAASSSIAKNATQQGRNNKLTQADRVGESHDDETTEGNEFSGALARAKAAGAKEFKVDGKTYQVREGKKPDFLDIDKDGDKEEPMDKAAKEKEDKDEVKESSPELEHLKALIKWAPKGTQVQEVTENMINQGTSGSSELDWLRAVVKYQPK